MAIMIKGADVLAMTICDAMETPQSKVVKQKPLKWAKGKQFFSLSKLFIHQYKPVCVS